MTTTIYKNFVIVPRNTQSVLKSKLEELGRWFPTRKPFEYKSDEDKIIFGFADEMSKSEDIVQVSELTDFSANLQFIVTLLCDNTDLQVIDIQYVDPGRLGFFLEKLWKYLITTIKHIQKQRDISNFKFRVHWRPQILNANLEQIISASGLMSNLTEKYHEFTMLEIESGKSSPTQTNTTSPFGSSTFGGFNNTSTLTTPTSIQTTPIATTSPFGSSTFGGFNTSPTSSTPSTSFGSSTFGGFTTQSCTIGKSGTFDSLQPGVGSFGNLYKPTEVISSPNNLSSSVTTNGTISNPFGSSTFGGFNTPATSFGTSTIGFGSSYGTSTFKPDQGKNPFNNAFDTFGSKNMANPYGKK